MPSFDGQKTFSQIEFSFKFFLRDNSRYFKAGWDFCVSEIFVFKFFFEFL